MISRALRKVIAGIFLGGLLIIVAAIGTGLASEKWQGVDESVVERYAAANGRPSHEPYVNTDQGDLLLFVFLLAGAAGGFAAGYCWRMLLEGKDSRSAAATVGKRNSDASV